MQIHIVHRLEIKPLKFDPKEWYKKLLATTLTFAQAFPHEVQITLQS